jgi:hypothetical protein
MTAWWWGIAICVLKVQALLHVSTSVPWMYVCIYVCMYCTYIGIDLPTYRDSVHGALLASVKYVLYVCTRQKRLG